MLQFLVGSHGMHLVGALVLLSVVVCGAAFLK
jgi:hypothetical protein